MTHETGLQLVDIESAILYSKDKTGKEYINRWGKPFKRMTIKLKDGRSASAFIKDDVMENLYSSQVTSNKQMELFMEQNGKYWNFALPDHVSAMGRTNKDNIASLEKRIRVIENKLGLSGVPVESAANEPSSNGIPDINPSDPVVRDISQLPF